MRGGEQGVRVSQDAGEEGLCGGEQGVRVSQDAGEEGL